MSKLKTVQYVIMVHGQPQETEFVYDTETNTYTTIILPELFLDEDEIVNHFISTLTQEEYKLLYNTPKDDLVLFHHTVGQYIRNTYGLWVKENPRVDLTDGQSENFPDQVSHRILEKVWDGLRSKTNSTPSLYKNYDKAMEILK